MIYQYYILVTVMYIILFMMGAVFYSYLALVIECLPKNENILARHTKCPKCGHEQKVKDVFPIFSRIAYHGKCRYCLEKLPVRPMLIEILGGALLMFCVFIYGISIQAFFVFIVLSDLSVISFIDADTQEIPPVLNLIMLALGVVSIFVLDGASISERLIGLFAISLPMFILAVTLNGFGGGDVKLMAVAGFMLGYKGIIIAFFIGAILGAAYAVYLLASKKKGRKGVFAFGPFLAIGIMIALINNFGATILQTYIDYLKSFQSMG